jgi:hypothetical protein
MVMISRSFCRMNLWLMKLLMVDGMRSWSMSCRHALIFRSWSSTGIPRSRSRMRLALAVADRLRLVCCEMATRCAYRSHRCMAYADTSTARNPRLGLHSPNARGESLAKKSAVDMSRANTVQNRFSNSCAWWTPISSYAMKR